MIISLLEIKLRKPINVFRTLNLLKGAMMISAFGVRLTNTIDSHTSLILFGLQKQMIPLYR